MKDWNSKGALMARELGAEYLRHASTVEELLQIGGNQALERLQARVQTMDETSYNAFVATLNAMIEVETQHLRRLRVTPASRRDTEQLVGSLRGAALVEPKMEQADVVAHRQARLVTLQTLLVYASRFRKQATAPDSQPSVPVSRVPASESFSVRQLRIVQAGQAGVSRTEMFNLLRELHRAESWTEPAGSSREQPRDGVPPDFDGLRGIEPERIV